MSSVAAPFGLRPIGRQGSGSQEVFRQYPIASGYGTNIAQGDIVQLVDGGTATTIEKQSGTGDDSTNIDMVGIFMGCTFTDPNTGQITFSQLWPASTVASDAMAYVVDNPGVEFAIQADGAPTNTGDIYGKNTLLVQTALESQHRIREALPAAIFGRGAPLWHSNADRRVAVLTHPLPSATDRRAAGTLTQLARGPRRQGAGNCNRAQGVPDSLADKCGGGPVAPAASGGDHAAGEGCECRTWLAAEGGGRRWQRRRLATEALLVCPLLQWHPDVLYRP